MTTKPRPDSSSLRKPAASAADDGAGKSVWARVEISRPASRMRRRAESSSVNTLDESRYVHASGLAKSARRHAPRAVNRASCIGVTAAIMLFHRKYSTQEHSHSGEQGCLSQHLVIH